MKSETQCCVYLNVLNIFFKRCKNRIRNYSSFQSLICAPFVCIHHYHPPIGSVWTRSTATLIKTWPSCFGTCHPRKSATAPFGSCFTACSVFPALPPTRPPCTATSCRGSQGCLSGRSATVAQDQGVLRAAAAVLVGPQQQQQQQQERHRRSRSAGGPPLARPPLRRVLSVTPPTTTTTTLSGGGPLCRRTPAAATAFWRPCST